MTQKPLTLQFVQKAINNPLMDENCCDFHQSSCLKRAFTHFQIGSKSFLKLYSMFLFAHFLFARRKKLFNNPLQQFKKFAKSMIKSLLFAGGYLGICRAIICLVTRLYACGQLSAILSATLGGSSLFFEPVQRRPEIALFIFTNTLKTLDLMMQRRNIKLNIPHGTCLIYVFSLGIICYHYFNNRECLRSSYTTILDKLLADS